MRIVSSKEVENALFKLIREACTRLCGDCVDALTKAAESETGITRFALDVCLENAQAAVSGNMPVCQDTGAAVVFIEIGNEVFVEGDCINKAVNNAVRAGYLPFRKSMCNPLTRENTADNTPAVLHLSYYEGDKIKITFMPKGFGSENCSALYMLKPSDGVDGIIDSIVKTVKNAGSKPCPPVYVGVGIGGDFEYCAIMAKKALARKIGTSSSDASLAEIERAALAKINDLNIGAQGFGGKVTALGVSCLSAPTHIAGLPVAVNIQCHCVRHGYIEI